MLIRHYCLTLLFVHLESVVFTESHFPFDFIRLGNFTSAEILNIFMILKNYYNYFLFLKKIIIKTCYFPSQFTLVETIPPEAFASVTRERDFPEFSEQELMAPLPLSLDEVKIDRR